MSDHEKPAPLGLAYGTVKVVAYDPAWAHAYGQERARLAQALPPQGALIEHIGSTSVPGLPAKPILDIAVLVQGIDDVPAMHKALLDLGYIYRGDKGQDGGHVYVFDAKPQVRTTHVHLIVEADPQWQAYLQFRDALRSDDETRQAYARLKADLAMQYPDNRRAYTGGKTTFVNQVLAGT